jgi:Zn-dependent protease/predicted transcriptional regulator
MGSDIKLGKIFGIEINLSYSWFIIFFLINFSFWSQFNRYAAPQRLIMTISTSLLFFLSVLAHELSHSLIALWRGLPVRSITLFIFGGVSRIEKEAMNAATEFWVAIVGPLSSLAVAGLFYLLAPMSEGFRLLSQINLMLAFFNMIPGFPLDGGHVLRAILWAATGSPSKATRIARQLGQGFAYALIAIGILLTFAGQPSALWLALIGWFLLEAARSLERAFLFERAMRGAHARDIMTADVPTVPSEISLAKFFDDHLIRTGRRSFIVVGQSGEPIGLMTPRELKSVPRQHWITTSVEQAMKPFEQIKAIGLDAELSKVLELMDQDDLNQVLIVQDGHVEGLVRREDLLQFIKMRAEFDH